MSFKNFDDATYEVEGRTTKITFEGRDFEVNLNPKAGPLLTWMESASRVEGIPKMLKLFFTKDEYEWILGTDAHWKKLEALVLYLAQEMADSGN